MKPVVIGKSKTPCRLKGINIINIELSIKFPNRKISLILDTRHAITYVISS
ncbi:hypothetical protein B4U80_03100 [Leptotrombidium deliense]|uniref:Uncharacterized protein n=1 Tax=Leptotrombidium deliense TaxID=299467 RepID=A0A443RTA3_9ACAR|nr:hypothetical protein B4U80_03100 [Leptotrombidium deliense]